MHSNACIGERSSFHLQGEPRLCFLWTKILEWVSIAVTLYAHIREVLGSNLGRAATIVTEVFVLFLNPSRKVSGWYLNLARAALFQILSHSPFIRHPTAQRYIAQILTATHR
jgi:hypothetical protein